MQDPDNGPSLLALAESKPSALLEGARPRLIDEWQEAPQLWYAVRFAVDRSTKKGAFILTGSSTPRPFAIATNYVNQLLDTGIEDMDEIKRNAT